MTELFPQLEIGDIVSLRGSAMDQAIEMMVVDFDEDYAWRGQGRVTIAWRYVSTVIERTFNWDELELKERAKQR